MEIKNKNYGFKFAKTNLNTIFSNFTKNLSPIQLKLKKPPESSKFNKKLKENKKHTFISSKNKFNPLLFELKKLNVKISQKGW